MAPGFQKVLDSQVTWAHRWDSCTKAAGQPAGLEKLLAWPRPATCLPAPPPCPDPENALRQLGRKALEGWTEVGSSPGPQEE